MSMLIVDPLQSTIYTTITRIIKGDIVYTAPVLFVSNDHENITSLVLHSLDELLHTTSYELYKKNNENSLVIIKNIIIIYCEKCTVADMRKYLSTYTHTTHTVYILFIQPELLNQQSISAMLKALEESQQQCVFLLISNGNLSTTIVSRCMIVACSVIPTLAQKQTIITDHIPKITKEELYALCSFDSPNFAIHVYRTQLLELYQLIKSAISKIHLLNKLIYFIDVHDFANIDILEVLRTILHNILVNQVLHTTSISNDLFLYRKLSNFLSIATNKIHQAILHNIPSKAIIAWVICNLHYLFPKKHIVF